MNLCGVKFKENGKLYYFENDNLKLKIDNKVVVETDKGEQLAKIVKLDIDEKKLNLANIKKIHRIATKKDYNKYLNNLKDAKESLNYAKDLVKKYNLNMILLDAVYTLDRKQLLFNFIADERIDFRNMVKDLAYKYKTRIELHQMGVRDKARDVGGIGQCGKELCCSSFLNNIDSISINMAKNQNIALNPNKINGVCGRLLCCLSYEDDVYTSHRELLPKVGDIITTPDGEGKVISLDVLNKKYTMIIDGEKFEYKL